MMYPEVSLHIDGAWCKGAGGKSEPVLNPATGDPIGDVPHAESADLELVPPPRRPPREHGDVPAVCVDVEVLRIEMTHPDPHEATFSQYGRTSPRRAARSRSASIAV